VNDERARRVGLNEAVFREVNERLEGIASSIAVGEKLDLVCECGDATCTARLRVDRGEYERTRADARHFLVCTGHVIPDVEQVIRSGDGFDVVEKLPGPPAEIAEETDPRT
jgi:hypothetical protein